MKKVVLTISFLAVCLTACSNQNSSTDRDTQQQTSSTNVANHNQSSALPVGDTAETSLDWNGTYKGVLPCADCEGIETTLTLNLDKSYELKQKYLSSDIGDQSNTKGKFEFDLKDPSVIKLDQRGDQQKFFVGENQILFLEHATGKRIEGPLAQHYILKKEN